MNKLFLKLGLVDFLLMLAYLIADYFEWNAILGLPLVATVSWTPVLVQIWFGGTVPVILDGIVRFYRWSFLVLLSIIGFNLAFVWRIGKGKEAGRG